MGVVAVGGFCRAMHHWENSNDTASIPLWSVLWRLVVCASVRRFLGVVSRCLCFSGLCKMYPTLHFGTEVILVSSNLCFWTALNDQSELLQQLPKFFTLLYTREIRDTCKY